MVSRTLLALFAVAFVAALVSDASAEKVDVVDVDDFDGDEDFERGFKSWITKQSKEAAKKILKQVLDFFKKQAKKVNLDCAKEVYDHCDINPLAHPKKYYNCAKDYVVEHKEHCYHSE